MRNNMVRVISVHNFLKQDISSLDEVNDVAAVPPDLILLVKSNNTILVIDLSVENDPGYMIPTIDQALKIVYSIQGNYIAALENKVTRNGTKVSYVRVYVNWETLKTNKESFPMRARIAGRVTPLSQSQQGLEMIEIPSHHMPDNVSCCPISGNLLLSSRSILTIYNFTTQIHDISKIHFIDFKQLSVDLHLQFNPLRIQLLENIIAAQNDEFLYVFQIKSALPMCSLSDKEFSIDDFEKVQNTHSKPSKEHETINYEKLVKECEKLNFSSNLDSTNDLQRILYENADSNDSELRKINLFSFPLKHEFPAVTLEKSLTDSRFPDVFRQNPLIQNSDLVVNLVNTSSATNCPKNQYKIINICQYHLTPLTIGSVTNREIQEKFITLILKPFYSIDNYEKAIKQRLFESDYFKNLKCVACFFGTQQEGYLHCFELDNSGEQDVVLSGNYITYAFTAPLLDVQLSDCFIHAITEVGLETYTMRAAKHLLKRTDSMECPSSGDPVCLIGLHPFLNVLKSFITNNYLTLFAKNEESSWTLYQLKTPDFSTIWKDFLTAANDNKWEAPLTYCELLNEGHLVLKTLLTTLRWISCKDITKNQLSFAKIVEQKEETEILGSLYKESCALLGDYNILNKNFRSAYCYYTMSGFKIMDIIKRIRSLWENIPEDYKKNYSEKKITKGLIFVLKKTLSHYDEKYYEFVGNREEFFSPEIGNLVTILMDLLEKEESESISDLVLESVVLREFSTDRILKMLKSLLSRRSMTQDKDALSLALMCIQRDQNEQAKAVLMTMKPNQLEALLLQYYVLLFANHSSSGTNMFTELSMVLIEIHPNVLAIVLSDLVTVKRLLSLSKVLNFFMDLMPSGGVRSRNSSVVLQIVLENYFKCYAENFSSKKFDYKTTEAIKILIRIYLTRLQPNNGIENDNEEEDSSEILFSKCRRNYLSHLPPFGHEFNQVVPNSNEDEILSKGQKITLLKIQSLLSFDGLQEECFAEVRNFLSKQPNIRGSLSLKVLSAPIVQEAISLLIDRAPQSLTHFSKERITEKDDWKFLVSQLHKKVNESNEDSRVKFYLQQILSDILHHIAENLNIEDLVDILPKDYEDAEKYLVIAQNSAQANHIKTLIMITGKQLLASLDLLQLLEQCIMDFKQNWDSDGEFFLVSECEESSIRLRRSKPSSHEALRQLYSTTVLLFLPILTANPPCTEYGVCKHLEFVPAPPGHTPSCAKPGSTYCEHVDHYPKQLIRYLIEKWGYDYNTLLSDESKDEFGDRRPLHYGPRPRPVYGPPVFHRSPQSVIQPSISFGPLSLNITHQPFEGGYPDRTYKIDPHLLTNALQQPPGYNPETPYINRGGYIYSQPVLHAAPIQQNLHSVQWWNRYKRSKDSLSRKKRQAPPGSSTQLCPTTSSFIMPRAALNTRGSWMYTVNLNEVDDRYTQLVRSETCVSNQCSGLCSLPNGYTSRCQQQYVQKRLVALEGGGERLYSDVFWFPHCCVCQITPN